MAGGEELRGAFTYEVAVNYQLYLSPSQLIHLSAIALAYLSAHQAFLPKLLHRAIVVGTI
jgi:hypothetical protein